MEKEIIEYLSEKVHEAWQEEKHKQGVYNHPDDIPYSKLAENIKEYDRATVRSVLKALGDIVGGQKMETEDKYEQALARARELYNAAKVYDFTEDMKRLEYIFHELKEDDEQKPADKVEPKFHEGDIIKPKNGYRAYCQIIQVDVPDRKYRFDNGYVINFSQEDAFELVKRQPTDKTKPKFNEDECK